MFFERFSIPKIIIQHIENGIFVFHIGPQDLAYISGVFSTGATGAIAPVILRKWLIAPAPSTRNGKILLILSSRNIEVLNTPLKVAFFNYVDMKR